MASHSFISSTVKCCPFVLANLSSKQTPAGETVYRSSWAQSYFFGQSNVFRSVNRTLFSAGKLFRDKRSLLLRKTFRFSTCAAEPATNSCSVIESSDLVDRKNGTSSYNIKIDQHGIFKFLVVPMVIAAIGSAVSIWQSSGSNFGEQAGWILVNTAKSDACAHFSFNLFGTKVFLAKHAPGWVYFWLLMAAGFGLFVSEEALNVWVGATLGQLLALDLSQESFFRALSRNAPYGVSTILWVYWGVCISDMVPFYVGKFAAQTKTSDKLQKKVGVSKQKLEQITQIVQTYGNFIGIVERFSLGMRNPTSFLAGALGVDPKRFFTGVCVGALITLPIQIGIGFFLYRRPLTALVGVAAVVGLWTVLPYLFVGLASLLYFIRNKDKKQY